MKHICANCERCDIEEVQDDFPANDFHCEYFCNYITPTKVSPNAFCAYGIWRDDYE